MTTAGQPTPAAPDRAVTFSPAERDAFRTPRVAGMIRDLSLIWLQAVAGIALFVLHPGVGTYLVTLVLVGGAQHGMGMVAHECAHRLLLPRSRRLNDWLGAWLFASPVLLPYGVYRQRHLAHHQLVSTDDDTKTIYRRDIRGWRFLLEAARSLSARDFVHQSIEAVRRGRQRGPGTDPAAFAARLRGDLRRIVVVQGLLFAALSATVRWRGLPVGYLLLWALPLMTMSFWFSKLRSIVEHQPLAADARPDAASPYFKGTPTPTLRSVRPVLPERLVLSKINFHFHAEHHLWPWVSYQHLPAVSARLWGGDSGTRTVGRQVAAMGGGYAATLRRLSRGD